MATTNRNSQNPTSSKEPTASESNILDGWCKPLLWKPKATTLARTTLSKRNKAILTPLLEAGQSEAALAIAIRHNLKAQSLLDRNRGTGGTPLHFAALDNDYPLLTELLDYGFDCNTLERSLCTPLMFAAAAGCMDTAKVLVERRANVHAANHSGNTALHMAVYTCREDMVELLIRAGSSTDARNNAGETPLMHAASVGSIIATKILVRFGADARLALTSVQPTHANHQEIRAVLEQSSLSQRSFVANGIASRQSM